MHDIDRTQREMEYAMHEMQPEQFEFAEQEGEFGEFEGEGEYEALGESFAGESFEGESFEGEGEYELEGEISEAEEMELAAELLEVANEAELEQFLGKLIRRVGRGLRSVIRSPLGRALGGVLKPLAKAALPIAGAALGSFVGGPVGGAIGGRLASAASQMFGLELEGLSGEDREFEVARRYVRFASATTRNAVRAPRRANPYAVARAAAASAARRHAPGLRFAGPGLSPGINVNVDMPGEPLPDGSDMSDMQDMQGANGGPNPVGYGRRGNWVRRGRRIVLFGV